MQSQGGRQLTLMTSDDPRFIVSHLCVHVSIVRVCELAFHSIIFMVCTYVGDGISLLRIPSKDASAYGRALLDTLFTKAEQKAHVLFKTSKSNKPPLDRAQVELMFGKNIDNN